MFEETGMTAKYELVGKSDTILQQYHSVYPRNYKTTNLTDNFEIGDGLISAWCDKFIPFPLLKRWIIHIYIFLFGTGIWHLCIEYLEYHRNALYHT